MSEWLPIIAVIIATVFAWWRQLAIFRAERRDRLRRAYSEWLASLERYQGAASRVDLVIEGEDEDEDANELRASTNLDEEKAFTYVVLLDPSEKRIKQAEKIREAEWWHPERIATAPGDNIHEQIRSVRLQDDSAKREFARALSEKLKEPV